MTSAITASRFAARSRSTRVRKFFASASARAARSRYSRHQVALAPPGGGQQVVVAHGLDVGTLRLDEFDVARGRRDPPRPPASDDGSRLTGLRIDLPLVVDLRFLLLGLVVVAILVGHGLLPAVPRRRRSRRRRCPRRSHSSAAGASPSPDSVCAGLRRSPRRASSGWRSASSNAVFTASSSSPPERGLDGVDVALHLGLDVVGQLVVVVLDQLLDRVGELLGVVAHLGGLATRPCLPRRAPRPRAPCARCPPSAAIEPPVIVIDCSLPVPLSFAETCTMPLASMSKVTSTCGMPRGAGAIAGELEGAERLVVAGELALALEDLDRDGRLVVVRGREGLAALGRDRGVAFDEAAS